MTRPTPGPDDSRSRSLLERLTARSWVTVAVLALIAVTPWLVPWQQFLPGADTSGSAAGPAVTSPTESASASQTPPDAGSVRALASHVAGAKGYDIPVSADEVAAVDTQPGPYVRLGRLQIPNIGVDTGFGEGVFATTLLQGPGHWPGTPMPGRAGNSVLSGHRNTHTQPFKRIDELRPGDKIIITPTGGAAVTFTVTGTKIVPEAKYKEYVLRQPDSDTNRQVTLFACHPEGNPIYRIVVRAEVS